MIMDLWFSSLFLVVGLFLSSSAQTPEECKPLVTPLSMANFSLMNERMTVIMSYVDNEVFDKILKTTTSSWVNVSQSASNPNELVMTQGNKINGTCMGSTATLTVEGENATTQMGNLSSTFTSLPACDGCVVSTLNSTTLNNEFKARALYLMAKQTTLKDSDLEDFKKQASCLGFTGEPNFHYNPENEFCKEGEGVVIFY